MQNYENLMVNKQNWCKTVKKWSQFIQKRCKRDTINPQSGVVWWGPFTFINKYTKCKTTKISTNIAQFPLPCCNYELFIKTSGNNRFSCTLWIQCININFSRWSGWISDLLSVLSHFSETPADGWRESGADLCFSPSVRRGTRLEPRSFIKHERLKIKASSFNLGQSFEWFASAHERHRDKDGARFMWVENKGGICSSGGFSAWPLTSQGLFKGTEVQQGLKRESSIRQQEGS